MANDQDYKFATRAIRVGHQPTNEREHSEAIFTTSSFSFNSAEQAEAVFANQEPGNIYYRFTNPTVSTFERTMASLECGERAVATSSGMSAILAVCLSVLKSGDHIVVARNIFGTITIMFEKYLPKLAIEISFVDLTDFNDWQENIKPNTKMLFLETPSNPLTQIADIKKISQLAHDNNSILVVDNVYCTPYLQQPLLLGADLVVHSAAKYLDGQGRVGGGIVVGTGKLIDDVYTFIRNAGTSMSAFNAWVISKGLETLKIRMDSHCKNASVLASWLEQQKNVIQVHYPGLKSHKQYQIAKQQQKLAGGVLSFEVKGGKKSAFKLMNKAKMIRITANIGDVKTILTHPASTTHGRLSQKQLKQAGINQGLIRISVGLENISDIINDLILE